MNRFADTEAKQSVYDGEVLMQYPVHNMEKAVMKLHGDLCEGKVYGRMTWLYFG